MWIIARFVNVFRNFGIIKIDFGEFVDILCVIKYRANLRLSVVQGR